MKSKIEIRSQRKSWSSQSMMKPIKSANSLKNTKKLSIKHVKSSYFPKKSKLPNKKQTPYLINPDSLLKMAWDIFCMCITISQSFVLPYLLTFSPYLPSILESYLEVSNNFLIFDMVLSLNTGFYQDGKLVSDRGLIICAYLKSFFLLDIWSVLPLQMLSATSVEIFSLQVANAVLLLKLLRLAHLKLIFYGIEDHWSSPKSVMVTRLIQFLVIISLLCHWLCCFMHYFYLLTLQVSSDGLIIYKSNFYDAYLYQLYTIVETMTSVGFVAPLQIYSADLLGPIVAMVIESLIFAFTLGEIQSIISKYTQYSSATRDIISQTKYLCNKKKIPKSLRMRIIRYIHYIRDVEENNLGNEADLLKALSKPLKLEIFTYTRSGYLERHMIFQNYSPDFLKFIGFSMKIFIYSKSDLIFQEGERGNALYFITNGSIEIYNEQTTTIYKTLNKGKSFGEIGFFLEACRSASARSEGFTELVALEKGNFERLLNDHPSEKEITREIQKRGTRDLSVLGVKCYLCKSSTHIARNCKQYMIRVEADKIIKNYEIKRHALGYGKKINLAIAIDNVFLRRQKGIDQTARYAMINAKGKLEKQNSELKKPSLERKAKRYMHKLQNSLPISKRKLKEIVDSEDERSSYMHPLPKSMRLIENFMEKKKCAADQPQIVVTKAPDALINDI